MSETNQGPGGLTAPPPIGFARPDYEQLAILGIATPPRICEVFLLLVLRGDLKIVNDNRQKK